MNGVPFLVLGKNVSVHGVIAGRQVTLPKTKPPMVKAVLVRDVGSPVPVVWWEEMDAPPEGSRVSVSGAPRIPARTALFRMPWLISPPPGTEMRSPRPSGSL